MSIKWLQYPEKMSDKIVPKTIVAHQKFVSSLKALQENLSFKESTMDSMFEMIGQEKNKVWKLTDADLGD